MKHHIVSIGISQHQLAGNNLQYAAKDATEFFKLCTSNLENIGYSKLLVDSEATLGQIRSAIGTELLASVTKGDAFFFFYSGHGVEGGVMTDPSVALNYLVPFDATMDFESSCISVDYLKGIFEKLPSQANFIFIDSCFSGSFTRATKGVPITKKKSFKNFRTFTNTTIGNGTLVFTACKDDQYAIEDEEYKNGLFAHELFSELQTPRSGDTYDALTIFTPVSTRVEERAKTKWSHEQTPTMNGRIVGALSFPVFKTPLLVTPTILSVPSSSVMGVVQPSVPIVDVVLPAGTKQSVVDDTVRLVIGAKKDPDLGSVSYERYCIKLLRALKARWEEIFIENGPGIEEVPNSVAKLEGEAFQFMVLGAVTAAFGSADQMRVYAKHLVTMLNWGWAKAGLVALIAIPEAIVADIIYLVAVTSVASERFEPLDILMGTKIQLQRQGDAAPFELIGYNHIFFTDSLTGYSNKVHDHIRDVLTSLDWLPELVPGVDEKVIPLQHQANLLLSVWMMHVGDRMWPDFARFGFEQVSPFVSKVKYDAEFRKKLAGLLKIKPEEVVKVFMECISEYERKGLGGSYWWNSIRATDFLTEEERQRARQGQQ